MYQIKSKVIWLQVTYGGSRGGSGGSVEPPKLNVKTYNKRVVKRKVNQGDFRAIKSLQIAPENAGNRISEALKLKIFRGSMPPDPPRGYRLRRPFIRTPPSSNPGSAPEVRRYYIDRSIRVLPISFFAIHLSSALLWSIMS